MSNFIISPELVHAIVTAEEAARSRRDMLLGKASSVTTITDRIDADDATSVLRDLKDFMKEIEDARVAAKCPVIEIGRKIDALGKELITDIKSEENRVGRMLGTFVEEERRKAEDARRSADAEIAHIANAAQIGAQKAAAREKTPEAMDRASDAVIEKAAARVVEIRRQQENATPAKVEGTSVRWTIGFEVTDLKLLYASEPNLVTLEPNGTEIRAIIRQNPNIIIPGLRHWVDHKLYVQ